MIRISMLLIGLMLLCGCWDKKELNEVAVIVGAGIDLEPSGLYKVTAQVIKPTSGGGSQQKSSGSEIPTWSLSAKGNTVMDAINHLNKISPRQLYWAHLQIIIFSEALAREGISPLISWFERDKDSRAGSYVVVTRGSAENILNKKIELGNISAKSMVDLLHRANLKQITARQIRLRDLTSQLNTPGIDPVLDVIEPKKIRGKVETYQLTGVSIFKGDKMAGFMKGPATMGTEIVFNNLKNTILDGVCPMSKKGHFTFQITDFKNKIKPHVHHGRIQMNMKIALEGNLSDQTCPVNLLKSQNEKEVEKQIGKIIESYVKTEFAQSKKLQADIFGIGRELKRYYPNTWDTIGKSKDYLNHVSFNIQIESNIRRSGLIIEPTELTKKELEE